jgi:DNA-binding LacI/PurR family transcriptional regulator/DNA-binding transcriptional regulator YhcF (GntR family)
MSDQPSSARVSQGSVLQFLRGQIVSGKCPPGSRLPSRREIIQQFGASSVTVQRAMDNLMRDGFAYSDGRNGTFVVEHPPHLGRYGLLLPSHPSDSSRWRRFTTVMVSEASRLISGPRRTLATYYDINGHPDSEDYQQLLRDLRGHRLAGLINIGDPTVLAGTPLLGHDAPPRVAFMESPSLPDTPALWHDHYSFIDQALDYFRKRGRRRIAIIAGEFPGDAAFRQYVVSSLSALDMFHPQYWFQSVFVGHPQLATNVAWLLLHGAPDERPDGLIISDDNLVESAIAGVMKSGVAVPADLDVVVHANLPWTAPLAIPTHRIGYPISRTLEVALDLIDRQRRGEQVPRITRIPAVVDQS